MNPAHPAQPGRGAAVQAAVNHLPAGPGLARAVCHICGCRSQAARVDTHGEPDLFAMAQGWSQAPYPANFRHADGSIGSEYTCPGCNAKFHRGLTLQTRAYLRTVVTPQPTAPAAA